MSFNISSKQAFKVLEIETEQTEEKKKENEKEEEDKSETESDSGTISIEKSINMPCVDGLSFSLQHVIIPFSLLE